jgi:hypothetical protein
MRVILAAVALSAASVLTVAAQPPPVFNIYREVLKEGHSGAHQKIETEFVRAERTANHPAYYLALESTSGVADLSLAKGAGEVFVGLEMNLFAVSPTMSYVSRETADVDSAFWRPKAAKPAAAAKPKE